MVVDKMKRACIIHQSLNAVGGGERVAIAIIDLLRELKYRVRLITLEPTDWSKVGQAYGDNIPRPHEEFSILPFTLTKPGMYMRFLVLLSIAAKRRCDLVINTHGDVLPVSADIVYMHFPMFAVLRESLSSIGYPASMLRKIYLETYVAMQKFLTRHMKWKVLVTNSEYSRAAIRKFLGSDSIVVYPPVRIEEFLAAGNTPTSKRRDIVVSCGRFTPEKRYEFVLEVTEQLPDIEFHIVGASNSPASFRYVAKLQRIIRDRRLQNVKLHINYPRRDQLKLYSEAKVYMHSMIGEHFGIAIVEAMAAGLVPIVHASGGAWNDIVYRGRYGYGYKTLDEAVRAIENALTNYTVLRERVVARAREFSYQRFKKRMRKIIETIGFLEPS